MTNAVLPDGSRSTSSTSRCAAGWATSWPRPRASPGTPREPDWAHARLPARGRCHHPAAPPPTSQTSSSSSPGPVARQGHRWCSASPARGPPWSLSTPRRTAWTRWWPTRAPLPARTASRAASSTCSTPPRRRRLAAVRARHGRVDGLVHLVGGWRGGVHLAEEPLEDWDWLHDLLVRTLIHLARVPRRAAREPTRPAGPDLDRPGAGASGHQRDVCRGEGCRGVDARGGGLLRRHRGSGSDPADQALLTPAMRARPGPTRRSTGSPTSPTSPTPSTTSG